MFFSLIVLENHRVNFHENAESRLVIVEVKIVEVVYEGSTVSLSLEKEPKK